MLTKDPIYKKQNLFRSNHHEIYTAEQNKKALSAYDNKRFILDNGIDTLAWGHHSLSINKDKFLELLKELPK